MTEPEDPYRLEDAEAAPPPAPQVERLGTPAVPARPPATGEPAVDTRTVAEKRGTAVDVVAGRRPPPAGWPGEAFVFPLRRPGPGTCAVGAVFWVLLDLAGRLNFFLGLLLKVVVGTLFLRYQIHVAARSAAGVDVPPPWGRAMEMRRDQIVALGRWLIGVGVVVGIGIVLFVFERGGIALALFAVGGLWLATGALGLAVQDPRISRPWNALLWIGRHPFALAAATLGWWFAGVAEWLGWELRFAPAVWFVLASLGLRLVFLYLWLLSGRFLGVVGRDVE